MSLRDELIEGGARAISISRHGVSLPTPIGVFSSGSRIGECVSDATAALDAILARLGEPENEMLRAGYEAMFVSEWDGTQAPMMGAGWNAMLATLEPKT